MLLLKSI